MDLEDGPNAPRLLGQRFGHPGQHFDGSSLSERGSKDRVSERIDILAPICPDGFYSNQEMAKLGLKYEGNDCIAAINKGIETLTDPHAGEWEKAFMLRVLLHAVGDIHCPMHCVQAYSEQFPQGDKGGVKFPLKGPDGIKHLHGLWDSIVLLGDVRLSRPLDSNDLRFVEGLADRITAEYPENGLKEGIYPEKWAKESHLAGKEAYLGIEVNTVPSEEYIQKSQKVACQRLALAGYRLANVLNECFPGFEVQWNKNVR